MHHRLEIGIIALAVLDASDIAIVSSLLEI